MIHIATNKHDLTSRINCNRVVLLTKNIVYNGYIFDWVVLSGNLKKDKIKYLSALRFFIKGQMIANQKKKLDFTSVTCGAVFNLDTIYKRFISLTNN